MYPVRNNQHPPSPNGGNRFIQNHYLSSFSAYSCRNIIKFRNIFHIAINIIYDVKYDPILKVSIHSVAKQSPNFNKPSSYVKFGLPSYLNFFDQRTCTCAYIVHEKMHATFVPFCFFFVSFLLFGSLSWLKMKKTEAKFLVGIDMTPFFHAFFPFPVRKSSKLAKTGQKLSKYHLFHPWWPKYAT